MLEELVAHYGWERLALHVRVNCFGNNPSIDSSLKFLRRTPWARKKVDALYRDTMFEKGPMAKPVVEPALGPIVEPVA